MDRREHARIDLDARMHGRWCLRRDRQHRADERHDTADHTAHRDEGLLRHHSLIP
jgi:hypothetical protein